MYIGRSCISGEYAGLGGTHQFSRLVFIETSVALGALNLNGRRALCLNPQNPV